LYLEEFSSFTLLNLCLLFRNLPRLKATPAEFQKAEEISMNKSQ
ncbi:unnamed protein product, partial [Tenebrio molitor]